MTLTIKKLLAPALAALAAVGTISFTTAPRAWGAPRADAADAAAESGVVNINTATEEELMLLPGVGPSKAAAIVAYRKKHGDFKKVEDLGKVKGFGYKTLKRLKPYLTVKGATTFKGKKSAQGDFLGAPPAEGFADR
jgi:competence protein ComEA